MPNLAAPASVVSQKKIFKVFKLFTIFGNGDHLGPDKFEQLVLPLNGVPVELKGGNDRKVRRATVKMATDRGK